MNLLLELDRVWFEFINNGLQNAFLDWIMPWWRNKLTWIPLYVLLLSFVVVKFKWQALFFIVGVALTIGLADTISSQVVKENVQRIRPCNNLELKEDVHLLIKCGSGYSFTSSHATNHFALATFISLTLGIIYSWIKLPLFLLAATISFGQVYVGVHYPLDVFAGAILGIIVGFLIAKIYLRFSKLKAAQSKPNQ